MRDTYQMSHDLSILHPRVSENITRFGLEAEVMECREEWADTAEFCANYDIPPDEACNTIVVVIKTDPKRYVATLVRADTRLDVNHKLAAVTGTKKMSFASGDETASLTGMMIGGVTVVGLPADMELLIDSRVFERERIIVGGGNRTSKLRISPEELRKLPNVAVADVSAPRQ